MLDLPVLAEIPDGYCVEIAHYEMSAQRHQTMAALHRLEGAYSEAEYYDGMQYLADAHALAFISEYIIEDGGAS
jgi:hypothetical protein